MMTLEAVREALRSPDPFAEMDRLVRAELAAGRRVRAVYNDLYPFHDALDDARDLTGDAEEAFLGTLDSLSGNCLREQCYEDPPEAAAEVAPPRSATVARAAVDGAVRESGKP